MSRIEVRETSRNLSPLVRAEQVRILYRQVPFASAIHVLLGALVVAVTGAGTVSRTAVVWYGLILATVAIRVVLWFAYRRSRPAPGMAAVWGRWYFIAMLCSGIAWGSGAFFIFPPDSFALQLFLASVMIGLAAGLTANTLANVSVIYAFLLAGITPYVVAFVLQGTLLHEVTAFMLAIFVFGTIMMARSNSRMFVELITLRLEVGTQRDLAEQANLAKSKFLAAASHDLRQPLHAMTLLADALNGRLQNADDYLVLARLQESLSAMRKLFNALLDISRLDAGIVEARIKDIRLSALLDRLSVDYARQAQEQNLEWRCPATHAVVRTDPVLLETLLRNLIGNALRYTPQGYVAIACREVDGWLRIEVEDSGVGIPADKHTEIFREYHQLSNPERDGAKGLGLGLAIVERLARLLNHRIELRSAPGTGSCFTVILPLGSASAIAPEMDGISSGETSLESDLVGMVVLVIDDQAAVLEGMQVLLGRWGCVVMLADSEAAAVAATAHAQRMPELIIADYRLRADRTGSQAIDRVRREFGESIPALIVTGDTAPERLREAQASGHMLMNKPVPPARLRAYLRTVRRHRALG
jgi:signal transduction histidine kinase